MVTLLVSDGDYFLTFWLFIISIISQQNERLKKGRVLLDWLEESVAMVAGGAVAQAAAARAPGKRGTWCVTSSELNSGCGSSKVSELHPDAQLAKLNGQIRCLEAGDATDQAALLARVWLLLRCGRIGDAQHLAYQVLLLYHYFRI